MSGWNFVVRFGIAGCSCVRKGVKSKGKAGDFFFFVLFGPALNRYLSGGDLVGRFGIAGRNRVRKGAKDKGRGDWVKWPDLLIICYFFFVFCFFVCEINKVKQGMIRHGVKGPCKCLQVSRLHSLVRKAQDQGGGGAGFDTRAEQVAQTRGRGGERRGEGEKRREAGEGRELKKKKSKFYLIFFLFWIFTRAARAKINGQRGKAAGHGEIK